MSKAYDMVEWSFLQEMIISMGFHSIWIDNIKRCISSVLFDFFE